MKIEVTQQPGRLPLAERQRYRATKIEVTVALHRQDADGDLRQVAAG